MRREPRSVTVTRTEHAAPTLDIRLEYVELVVAVATGPGRSLRIFDVPRSEKLICLFHAGRAVRSGLLGGVEPERIATVLALCPFTPTTPVPVSLASVRVARVTVLTLGVRIVERPVTPGANPVRERNAVDLRVVLTDTRRRSEFPVARRTRWHEYVA